MEVKDVSVFVKDYKCAINTASVSLAIAIVLALTAAMVYFGYMCRYSTILSLLLNSAIIVFVVLYLIVFIKIYKQFISSKVDQSEIIQSQV